MIPVSLAAVYTPLFLYDKTKLEMYVVKHLLFIQSFDIQLINLNNYVLENNFVEYLWNIQ